MRDPNDLDGEVWDQSGVFAGLRFSVSPISSDYGYYDYGYGGESQQPYRADDEDWVGTYRSGDSIESIDGDKDWLFRRSLSLAAFADGLYFETEDVSGLLEVTEASSDEIKGKIEHQWFRGKFVAEVCGRGSESDSGYYGDDY